LNIDITSSLRCALRETLIGNQQLILDIGCGNGQITALYSSERKSKRRAIEAARNLSGKAFSLTSEKTIQNQRPPAELGV
jgi:tRNA G46 methylase TrmB